MAIHYRNWISCSCTALVIATGCNSRQWRYTAVCNDEVEQRFGYEELSPPGVSASDLIAHAGGEREIMAAYVHEPGLVRLTLSVERTNGAARWVRSRMEDVWFKIDQGLPSASIGGADAEGRGAIVECLDHLQVPVRVRLTADDGAVEFVRRGVVTTRRFSFPDDPEQDDPESWDALAWLWADQQVDKVEQFPPYLDYELDPFDPHRVWVQARFREDRSQGGAGWTGLWEHHDRDGIPGWHPIYSMWTLEWEGE